MQLVVFCENVGLLIILRYITRHTSGLLVCLCRVCLCEPVEMLFGLWTWMHPAGKCIRCGLYPEGKRQFWGSFFHSDASDCVSSK